jgi:histidine triad (HIT) family protein
VNTSAALDTCIFCGIASGRLPASIVHEDDDWMAVMDIHPIRQGHVLLIPRRHVSRLAELDEAEQRRLFVLADAVLKAQEAAGYANGGSNLLLNDGVAANQHIPHLHLHCIPRRRGDTLGFGLRLLARTVGLFGFGIKHAELNTIATAIRAQLQVPPSQ